MCFPNFGAHILGNACEFCTSGLLIDEASAEAWFKELYLLRAGLGLRKGAAMGREAAMPPTDAHPARIAERSVLQREECRAEAAAG